MRAFSAGWSSRTRRPAERPPAFTLPLITLTAAVYVYLNTHLYLFWITTARFPELFAFWQTPGLFGQSLGGLLIGLDFGFAVAVALEFIGYFRRFGATNRLGRIACLAMLGVLALLHPLHYELSQSPCDEYRGEYWSCYYHLGDKYYSLRIRDVLLAPDLTRKIAADARRAGGHVRAHDSVALEVRVPAPGIRIPLRDGCLSIRDGRLWIDETDFWRVWNNDTIRITPVGVFVQGVYRGDLPH